MKKENGITLVALVVTIIIALILVAVSICFVINARMKNMSSLDRKTLDNEFGEDSYELFTAGFKPIASFNVGFEGKRNEIRNIYETREKAGLIFLLQEL